VSFPTPERLPPQKEHNAPEIEKEGDDVGGAQVLPACDRSIALGSTSETLPVPA
jgi:hypothetical protein